MNHKDEPKAPLRLTTIDMLFLLIIVSTIFQITTHADDYVNGFQVFIETWQALFKAPVNP